MTTSLNITEARSKLLSMPRSLKEGGPHAVEVTQRGKAVLAILPFDLYESLLETLDVLAEPDLAAELRRSLAELQAGKAIPWSKAKKTLGL